MQDLKNNDRPGRQDNGRQNADGQHLSDQQLRHRLADAEVAPPPELMDKILGVLERPQASGEQNAPAAPVKPLRRFWRFSNVAAIAGILVVLAIGIRELNLKSSIALNPSAKPPVPSALTPERPASKDAKKDISAVKAGNMDGGAPAPEAKNIPTLMAATARHMASKPSDRRSAAGPKAGAESGGGDQKTAFVAGSAQGHIVQADQKSSGNAAEHLAVAEVTVQNSVSEELPALTAVPPRRKALAATSPVMQEDAKNTAMRASAPDKNEVGKTALMVDSASHSDNISMVLAPADDADRPERHGRSERRGLLKTVFKKIGNTARAITEEVVSEDEDKTVINVGVLAITAYK